MIISVLSQLSPFILGDEMKIYIAILMMPVLAYVLYKVTE